ncbi:MAG: CDP-alcohol phosphatidyltransferase family protein [Gammaproteobacteria bacterium]|nr:CDP-alcohol phosphatidyltransferase family protein [Gammaproteobacteria bacterium]MDP2139785.1 CDP-alcohol phosphatidyltransferase family protein [Gammaproteobacteria bacterium]MDP2346398.1 CDP-alcohol phosphatidyltransferase family protein [Gammaproteobacteria bacterium]
MKQELQGIGLLGGVALAVCATALGVFLGWSAVDQWLLLALLLWGFVCQQSLRRHDLNRFTLDADAYPDLGLANRLTLLRGWLIAATGGFLLLPADASWIAWIPAALYSIAAILDRVDGFVARRTARTSVLGNQLDTVFDALGLLVAPLLAVSYGKVHWSYLFVSIAYYCFVWGLHWRRTHELPVYPLAPSKLRRALAGFQMGYVAVVLWPPFDAHITVMAGFGFMVPLLIGFVVDWLVVSGRIDAAQPTTMSVFARLTTLSESILQPILRLLIMMTLLYVVMGNDSPLAIPVLIAATLVLLGLGGRIAALALLMLLAWQFPGDTPDVFGTLALYSAIGVLLLGCGRFSLWQWDDLWVNRQDGA